MHTHAYAHTFASHDGHGVGSRFRKQLPWQRLQTLPPNPSVVFILPDASHTGQRNILATPLTGEGFGPDPESDAMMKLTESYGEVQKGTARGWTDGVVVLCNWLY